METAAFNKEEAPFHQRIRLKFVEETSKMLLLSISLCGAETWIPRGSRSGMWCWRRMEKISWAGRVRNELMQRVKKDRTICPEYNKKEEG
jgi:hypothetical protein